MRILKWFFGLIFLLVTLAIILAAYFVVSFDANEYKDRIIQTVKNETGRELILNGELDMSLYPKLGVNVKDAMLSNAGGFESEQFFTLDEATIRLQLIPLLKKNIVADRIEFSGMEVWLERDIDGKTNWDDILERLQSDEKPTESGAGISGSIAGLDVRNTKLHWKDAQAKTELDLEIKNFVTGELTPDAPTDIDGEFGFRLNEPEVQGQVIVKGVTKLSQFDPFVLANPELSLDLQGLALQAENIKADIDTNEIRYQKGTIVLSDPEIEYTIRNMPSLGKQAAGKVKGAKLTFKDGNITIPGAEYTTDVKGSELPGETLKASVIAESFSYINEVVELKAVQSNSNFTGEPWPQGNVDAAVVASSLKLDMKNGALTIPDFSAKALGLNIKGSTTGSNVLGDVLKLNGTLNIADFSPKKVAPKLDIELPEMSNEAWTQANLSGNYTLTKNSLGFTNLRSTIDGTEWSGSAALADIENKKLSFNLAAASLDANRLIPPKQADALQDKKGSEASKAAVAAIEIPQKPLKDWDAKGTVKLGILKFGNIESTNLEAGINLLDGKLRVYPSKANFFGGQYSGDIRLDVSGATPRLQANEKVTNIDLAALGAAMWENNMMTGRTNARIELDTRGATIGQMQENATGDADFKISDGVMQGFDLNYAVANALSVFKNKTLSNVENTRQTAFETLTATAKLNNGLLQNDDFLAVMPRMRIRGKGNLNTLDTSINYQVSADVLESKSAAIGQETQLSLDELVGATIPIKVTGTLAEPKIRPDVAGFLKAKAEQELRDKAKEALEDKLKDKVGGVLGDILGDALGGSTESMPEASGSETPAAADEQAVPDEGVQEEVPPEEELDPVEQKKKELEEKAKDKLKDIFGG